MPEPIRTPYGLAPALSADERAYLERTFTYHPPVGDQAARYVLIRAMAWTCAETILLNCPPCPERERALTRLEEAVMHANASIARHEPVTGSDPRD